MIMVRVILVDTTFPVKIRPRMETSPVKGHFLSAPTFRKCMITETYVNERTDVSTINGIRRDLEA